MNDNRSNSLSLAVGIGLVLLGVLFLAGQFLNLFFGQFFNFDIGRYAWPFFVILPGIFLFGLSLAVEPGAGRALGVVGGVISMTGLLLAYQNFTNHWESWAYAWALAGPTGAGLGLAAYGLIKGQGDALRSGLNLAAIGAAIFVVGAVFFELVIGNSGVRLPFSNLCWPAALIGLGVIMLVINFLPRRRKT